MIRTQAQADATRPHLPGPNGFRRMDLLTNEGRSWYQGVRIAFAHRTNPLSCHRVVHAIEVPRTLNHWFSPEDSTNPESDRGPTGADTPHNLVTSVTWNVPGSGPVLSGWRLSTVSHSSERRAVHHPLRRRPDGGAGVSVGCNSRGCQASRPAAATPNAGCSSTTRT